MSAVKRIISIILILTFFTYPAKAAEYPSLFFSLDKAAGLVYYVPKGNTINLNDNEFYFKKTNTNDAYVELFPSGNFSQVKNFVIDFEYDPVKIDTDLRIFRANTENSSYKFLGISSNGNLNAGEISVPVLEKTKITLCVDLSQKKGKLYTNGSFQGQVSYADLSSNFIIQSFRLGIETGGKDTEFYIRNIKIYSGNEPYSDDKFNYVKNTLSVMDIEDGDDKAKRQIGENIVFSQRYFFADGQKHSYNDDNKAAYLDEEVLMIPSDMCAYIKEACVVNGSKISFAGASMEVGKNICTTSQGNVITLDKAPCVVNNILFLPAKNICELASLYTYCDERGFVIAGNNPLSYQNSKDSYNNRESIDTIYRYMYFDRPSGTEIVNTLKSAYADNNSRLLITKDRINKVKENIKNDKVSKQMYNKLINEAEAIPEPSVEYKIDDDGFRLFTSCITVKKRLLTLSSAYMLTDDATKKEKYASKIWAEMQNALNWKDWNTSSHFLDSGKIAVGIAVGYDTLRNYLSNSQKQWVIERVNNLYLDFCTKAYLGRYSGSEFRYSQSNWGAVCAGGILTMCIAFAPDVENELRETVEYLIENSMHSLEYPVGLLYPDGAWHEGVGYWGYVAEYLTSYCVGVLQNTCGEDFGFSSSKGFYEAFDFVIGINGPCGVFNYSSNGEKSTPYYISQAYQASLIDNSAERMSNQYLSRETFNYEGDALDVLWYEPSLNKNSEISLSKDTYFAGSGIGVMRDSWYSKNGAYVGVKAGLNPSEGRHFDKGSFVYDYSGVRWAIDLGRENPTIDGYYGDEANKLYRNRAEGHNVVVINPNSETGGQLTSAEAYLEDADSSDGSAYMIYNLNDVYADNTNEYKRGFYFEDNRESLTIRDEISLKNISEIYWFMHTRADIQLDEDKKGATLFSNGQKLRVTANCNSDNWFFEVRKPEPFDSSMKHDNEFSLAGIKKLTLYTKSSGNVNITVKLSPVDSENTDIYDIPLNQWELSDAQLASEIKMISSSVLDIDENGKAKVKFKIPLYSDDAKLYINDKLIEVKTNFGLSEDAEFQIDAKSMEHINGALKLIVKEGNNEYVFESPFLLNVTQSKMLYSTDFTNIEEGNEITYLQKNGFDYVVNKGGSIVLKAAENAINIVSLNGGNDDSLYFEKIVNVKPDKKLKLSFDIVSRDGIKMYFSASGSDDFKPSPNKISIPDDIHSGNISLVLDGNNYVITSVDKENNLKTYYGEYKINGFSKVRLTFFADEENKQMEIDNFAIQELRHDDVFKKFTKDGNGLKLYLSEESKMYSIYQAKYNEDEMVEITKVNYNSRKFIDFNMKETSKVFIWDAITPVTRCIKH